MSTPTSPNQNQNPEPKEEVKEQNPYELLTKIYDNAQEIWYNVVRSSKYLPEAFILYPHLVKISFTSNFIDPTANYISRSGLTWEKYAMFDEKLVEVRGLYIVSPPLLTFKYRMKVSRELKEYESWLIQKLKELQVPSGSLIHYDNWGFEVYDRYRKAKLIQFELLVEQGHLYGYRVPLPVIQYDEDASKSMLRLTEKTSIYNHEITADKKFIEVRPKYVWPGDAVVLISISDELSVTFNSPDHGEDRIKLGEGEAILLWHRHPRSDNVD